MIALQLFDLGELAFAGDTEEAKLLVGTWGKFGATTRVYRSDGPFIQGLTFGTWKASDGKLVQIRDLPMLGTEVEQNRVGGHAYNAHACETRHQS